MATVKPRTISTACVAGGSLSDQDLLAMYRQMVLVRTLEREIQDTLDALRDVLPRVGFE